MNKSNLALTSLIQALGVFVYVLLIGFIFSNGNEWFGKLDQYWGPVVMLMLLVVSAAICGTLVLGKPIMLYLDQVQTVHFKLENQYITPVPPDPPKINPVPPLP